MTTVNGKERGEHEEMTYYLEGRVQGERQGSEDLELGLGFTRDMLARMREQARTWEGRGGREWTIGWLRGYRDSVRTFERGRWGT